MEPVQSGTEIPNDVESFFQALYAEVTNQFIELRPISRRTGANPSFHRDLAPFLCAALSFQASDPSANVYFGVCPRIVQAGSKDAISMIPCFWADLDAKHFKGGKEEALAILREFAVPPSAIVDSGNGYHAYWFLREPLLVEGQADVAHIEKYLKGIARLLGGDSSVSEIARVLRVPGTLNVKDPANPRHVAFVELEPDRRYNPCDFEDWIDVQHDPEGSVSEANAPGWIADSIESLRSPSLNQTGNRHETAIKLAGALNRAGLIPADICALVYPHFAKVGYSPDELRRDVEDICRRYPAGKSFQSPDIYAEESETKSTKLEALSVAELLATGDIKFDWRIHDLLAVGCLGILAGPGGVGKTWLLLDAAIECARGGKWLGHFPTPKCRVLYIDEESGEMLLRVRLSKLLKAKGLTGDLPDLLFVVRKGVGLSSKAAIEQLDSLLSELKPGLLIIDSLIRIHRAEENSASEMSRIFDVVRKLAAKHSLTVLFADHQKKQSHPFTGTSHLLRGSSDKRNAVDSVLLMQSKDKMLVLIHDKSRYVVELPDFLVEIADLSDSATEVKHAGDAEHAKKVLRIEAATEVILSLLRNGEWVSRPELVEKADEVDIGQKAIDEAIKELGDRLERENRPKEGKRGGKVAYFRLRGAAPGEDAVTSDAA